jgi:hypothetical protein
MTLDSERAIRTRKLDVSSVSGIAGMLAMTGVVLSLTATESAASDYDFFQTPTGNIACMFYEYDGKHGARCDIREKTPSYRSRPDCGEEDGDWGMAFSIKSDDGVGTMPCYTDTVIDPSHPVLNYGKSISAHGITCTSAKTGLTCKNSRGHGFFLSRARQKLF